MGDTRCECCGRPWEKLEPFGQVGDKFYKGRLWKIHRPDAPHNEVVERIYDEFFGNCPTEKDVQKAKEKLVQKYGQTIAEHMINWSSGYSVGSSWECRDCICLDDYAFQERRLDSLDPPERCDCCGRLLGELKPCTEGDPVASHFEGKLLARRMRPEATPIEGVNKMMDEFFGNCITYDDYEEAGEKLIQKYGKEKTHELCTFAFLLGGTFKSSWECKDCIVLDTHQYLEKKMAQESDGGHDNPLA